MNVLSKSVAATAGLGLLVLSGAALPEGDPAVAEYSVTRASEPFVNEPLDLAPDGDPTFRPLSDEAGPVVKSESSTPLEVKGEIVVAGCAVLLSLGGLIFAASRWSDLK